MKSKDKSFYSCKKKKIEINNENSIEKNYMDKKENDMNISKGNKKEIIKWINLRRTNC